MNQVNVRRTLVRFILFDQTLENAGIAFLTVLQAAVDTADGCAAGARLFQYFVVYAALVKQRSHLIVCSIA